MKKIKKERELLVVYFNEFNYLFLKKNAQKYKCSEILKLLKKKIIATTTQDKIQGKNLDPWVHHVSINTGQPSKIHKVYTWSKNIPLKKKQIWDLLAKKGIKSYAWCPMNAKYIANKNLNLFFPDPWNFSNKIYPYRLRTLGLLPRYYAQNYTDPKIYKIIGYILSAIYGLVINNYILKLIKDVPNFLFLLLWKGWKNYLLFLFLDYISIIILKKELQKNKSSFVFLFLNSIAHFQHNNWDSKEKDKKFFFKFINKICKELNHVDKSFKSSLIFNGFEQKQIKNQYLLRPKNPSEFLKTFGITFTKVEQNMTNGGLIFFKNKSDRILSEKILRNFCIGNYFFFSIKKMDEKTLFYRIQVRSSKNFNHQINSNKEINKHLFYDLGKNYYNNIDRKSLMKKNKKFSKFTNDLINNLYFIKSTGIHNNKGTLFYKNVLIDKKIIINNEIENHEIYNIIKKHFI